MVNFCGVFACDKRADRDMHLSFFRLPTIRVTGGDQMQKLSEDRQHAQARRKVFAIGAAN